MPRKRIVPSLANVRAQWKLLKDMGEDPVSVKFHADGTFRIMTKKHAEITKPPAVAATGANPWDEVLL